MCGIHGIIALQRSFSVTAEAVNAMGNATIHRGPDDFGVYVKNNVGIGMRRLSIIDLSGGHQPISNEDDSLWLVCNGEIYNFQELRSELISKGHHFKTGSDVEVLLHLYEEYGDEFVTRLRGMFGFALWDGRRERLLVGRDRLGIKPIYYLLDQQKLVFASEAKAILALPNVSVNISANGLEQYLAFGYVPTPYSLFDGIEKLPPGCMMVYERGEVKFRDYWKFEIRPRESLSEVEWNERLLNALEESVKSQMVSDVPLGAFLSGGIDSSCVVAFMAKHSRTSIKTYSIGFDSGKAGQYYNELPFARQVSRLFNTDHKEILVAPNVVELLPKLLWHMDEPMADAAFITTYLVSEFARKDVTVILSGVGGDELFGGYRRYLGEHYGEMFGKLPGWLRNQIIVPLAKHLPADRHSPLLNFSRYARSFILSSALPFVERYRSYVQVFSPEVRAALLKQRGEEELDVLAKAFSNAKESSELDKIFHVDMVTQLPDDLLMLTDKMTMATSLECRVPLLDERLVDLSCAMPNRYKIRGRELKYSLKKALSTVLPEEILYRKKRGFGAPMGAWLKQELAPMMKFILSKESVENRGLFSWAQIDLTMKLHESNREDYTDHLLALMNLEIWCRLYLDKKSPSVLVDEIKRGLVA